jgi:hypothetical protein
VARDSKQTRVAAWGLALSAAFLLLAFGIGMLMRSVDAFGVVLAVGLAISVTRHLRAAFKRR